MASVRRVLRLTGFVVLLVAAQAWFLHNKVSWLPPEDYATHGHDLKPTRTWRFGYVSGRHGARLVRTAPEARPAGEAGLFAPGSDLDGPMLRELQMAPALAGLELVLYLLVTLAVARVGRFASVRRGARWRWLLLPLIAGWLLSLPLLAVGYGSSIYSNYVGPGAFSSSGPYLRVSFIPAETVSYRSLMEALGLAPLWLLRLVRFGQWFPDVPFELFWCVVVVGFYGVVGLASARAARTFRMKGESPTARP
jgi:hypothetical protein